MQIFQLFLNYFTDRKYSVIQCTGYLKSWALAKIGLEETETDGDGDSCNLSCLVAVGRVQPHISMIAPSTHKPNVRPIQFISRHAMDGKFLFVDQRFGEIFEYNSNVCLFIVNNRLQSNTCLGIFATRTFRDKYVRVLSS